MNKAAQRAHVASAIEGMTDVERRTASEAICTRLSSIASVSFADTIFAYLALDDEVDLSSILNTWIDESRTIGVAHPVEPERPVAL